VPRTSTTWGCSADALVDYLRVRVSTLGTPVPTMKCPPHMTRLDTRVREAHVPRQIPTDYVDLGFVRVVLIRPVWR
jgi:hypothetical protein